MGNSSSSFKQIEFTEFTIEEKTIFQFIETALVIDNVSNIQKILESNLDLKNIFLIKNQNGLNIFELILNLNSKNSIEIIINYAIKYNYLNQDMFITMLYNVENIELFHKLIKTNAYNNEIMLLIYEKIFKLYLNYWFSCPYHQHLKFLEIIRGPYFKSEYIESKHLEYYITYRVDLINTIIENNLLNGYLLTIKNSYGDSILMILCKEVYSRQRDYLIEKILDHNDFKLEYLYEKNKKNQTIMDIIKQKYFMGNDIIIKINKLNSEQIDNFINKIK